MEKAKCPQEIDGGLHSHEPQIHLGGDLLTCRVKRKHKALAQDGQALHGKAELGVNYSFTQQMLGETCPSRFGETSTGMNLGQG